MVNNNTTNMKLLQAITVLLVLIISSVCGNSKGKRGINRALKIMNKSGSRVGVFWVHPNTGELSPMSDSDLVNGAEFPLDSYVGHKFELHQKPNSSTGECKSYDDDGNEEKVCKIASFTVSENDDQVAEINEQFQIIFIDNKVKAEMQASDLIKDCQMKAKQKIKLAGSDIEKSTKAIDELLSCVEGGVAKALETVNEEIAFQASVRKDIAATLENYTCVDETLDSTPDITTTTWIHISDTEQTGRQLYNVHVKHDRPASKIHLIENFIRDDECEAMEKAAAATLHRATVADGKGGSRLSENRKAMQAGITVPWDTPDHPISKISRRVYDYTNHVLGLDIKENGQEDLMSIQYFGRGKNDTEPDRYTPHCDGDCTGLPHKTGTRMATMVMYCNVATSGGHTNFRNAGVHVKPESNNAIFFSYIDPKTKLMDTGFTEHSGCPVYEGTKKIVTQWIRYGVSDDTPWTAFNTLGIKKTDIDE